MHVPLRVVCQGDDTGFMAEYEQRYHPVLLTERLKFRRCALKILAVAFGVSAFVALCSFHLSMSFSKCLGGAHISLRNATVEISSNALEFKNLQLLLSLTPSTLNVLGLSYTLNVEKSTVDLGLSSGSEISWGIAYVTLPEQLVIESRHGVDKVLDATFAVARPELLGEALQTFLTKPELRMWSRINYQVWCRVWGWLPLYIPSLTVVWPASMPAMNLISRPVSFHRLFAMEGKPDSLRFVGDAFLFNPSPVTLIIKDALQMRVSYDNTVVGNLNVTGSAAAAIQIKPAVNMVSGELTLSESINNTQAISSLMTDYIGNTHKEKTLSVSVAVPMRSTSGPMLKLFGGVRMPVNFKPVATDFLTKIAADFVVGGHITHWPPASLDVTVHPTFHNPMPVRARLEHISLDVLYKNGSIDLPLFRFSHHLHAKHHVIPPLGNATFHLPLWISDVLAPGALALMGNGSGNQRRLMHVNAKLRMILLPAHRIDLDIKSEHVPTVVCVSSTGPSRSFSV